MGYGTSLGTAHEDEISYVLEKGLTDKQLADQSEINSNEKSDDFQSRFYATDQSTMPLEASRKLTDALKQTGSTGTPEKVPETKRDDSQDIKVNPWVTITPEDIDKGIHIALSAGSGTIAGVTSKTLDKGALEVAQAAEQAGHSVDEIWKSTGFFRGADKRWRYEIDDSGAALKTPEFIQSEFTNYRAKLGDLLDHPELYKAYPGIENVPVNVLPWYPPKGAFWNGSSIGMGKEAFTNKSTVMHEVQHAIQDREAFAQGGTPGKAGKDYKLMYEDSVDILRKELFGLQKLNSEGSALSPKEQSRFDYLIHVFETYAKYARAGDLKARENYMALAGETEARNVEIRLPLEPKDRLKISPLQTEDIARSKQIVRDKPTLTTPYRGNDGFLSY